MDLSQVTLTQMRYAIAIADSESFRAAAERSHVSQSGLSMQVQKLEELLGVVLFDRSRKPVMLTAEGERALLQMRVVLRELERLGQTLADAQEPAGPFRLGVIPTLSRVIPLFLRTFLEKYPRVELSIEELKTDEIISRLHADTLDAGLAATPLSEAGLHEQTLGVEALYAYLPPGDRWLDKATISQAQLASRELWVMPEGHCFRSQVLSYCSGSTSRSGPGVRFESGSFETLIRLVDAGMGATVLPALVVADLTPQQREEQVRPLVRPAPVREIGLLTARVQLRHRINEALSELVRSALSEALGERSARGQVLEPRASS